MSQSEISQNINNESIRNISDINNEPIRNISDINNEPIRNISEVNNIWTLLTSFLHY